ncbi:hypothetical protein [Shewanella sp.]|uniref:hypothetical protein n=1 Tax=Shewanella sp. TaxID=50422 RepID=UPI001EC7EB98|nr:hypothetical protein [Shewanella sp.]NRB23826.1 hypothetical protein [Shewanella sp.]
MHSKEFKSDSQRLVFYLKVSFVFTAQWFRLGGSVAHTLMRHYRISDCHTFPNETHHLKSFNSKKLLSKSELLASKIQIEEANTLV